MTININKSKAEHTHFIRFYGRTILPQHKKVYLIIWLSGFWTLENPKVGMSWLSDFQPQDQRVKHSILSKPCRNRIFTSKNGHLRFFRETAPKVNGPNNLLGCPLPIDQVRLSQLPKKSLDIVRVNLSFLKRYCDRHQTLAKFFKIFEMSIHRSWNFYR